MPSLAKPPRFSSAIKTGIGLLLAIVLPLSGLSCLSNLLFGHDVELFDAAREQNWGKVRTLLEQGADPNDTTDLQNKRTALFWIILEGRADIVRLMIQKGVNGNLIDTHQLTALDYTDSDISEKQPAHNEIVALLKAADAKHAADIPED